LPSLIGTEIAAKVEFVCSDMWKSYLKLIAKHCHYQCASVDYIWQTPSSKFLSRLL
jgi:hypothetical protein